MTKNNIIITFDLHEVIFTFDYKKVATILWNTPHKWKLFTTLFHLPFIWNLVKMVWNDATDEAFYKLFEQRRPILLPLVIKMTNAQKIIPGMETIVKELADQGYTLHILSNIGPRRFKQLSQDFPQVIGNFKTAKIVQPHSNPTKKPAVEFFQDYLKNYIKPGQHVIFIDDNKKNIQSARSLGITAIPFKSAAQLRNELEFLKHIRR